MSPESTIPWPNVGSMLGRRCRRWTKIATNIGSTSGVWCINWRWSYFHASGRVKSDSQTTGLTLTTDAHWAVEAAAVEGWEQHEYSLWRYRFTDCSMEGHTQVISTGLSELAREKWGCGCIAQMRELNESAFIALADNLIGEDDLHVPWCLILYCSCKIQGLTCCLSSVWNQLWQVISRDYTSTVQLTLASITPSPLPSKNLIMNEDRGSLLERFESCLQAW